MKGDMLFAEYYEPGLIQQGVQNVVLRTYAHIKGLSTDDPDNSTEVIYTPRVEVDQRMNDIHALFGEDRGIAMTSLVSVGAEQKHLLLIDCAVPVSEENEVKLVVGWKGWIYGMGLRALRHGMLLRTQNSYHVVGFCPLSREEWHRQMALTLLLKTQDGQPIADVRYIGHSLERGYGSLRLSDYQGKPTPDFVREFRIQA